MNRLKQCADMEELQRWKHLIEGDETALAGLMRDHYKPLVNYGFKFIKDEEFVKDCIQDLFIELWNRRKTLSEPDSIRAYLCVCLKRKIFRSGSKLRLFDYDHSSAFFGTNDFDIEFSPEWWLIQEEDLAEKTREMAKLLNTLPRRQREVIYLKYYQELGRDEIAAMMSIAPQTVSNLLQIALAFLRENGKTAFISLFFTIIKY